MTKVPLQPSPAMYEPEHVMNYRGGSVLGKKTILKSDHFPGCQNKRLTPQIDCAPNYRQAGSLPVHGVAIPTINGIRNVLIHIGARQNGKQKKVLWHNLREEPVVYINDRPFVLRDVEKPFSNLEYTGINRARVEQMESRLKEDILVEAARYGSKILVTDELPDGQMMDLWEPVTRDHVKTPLEVYQELQMEGYLVDYERVPITDEKSPKERDFDDLLYRISQVEHDTEFIFNCQMGRGRTTTGMVIATLVYLNRIGASGIPRTHSIGKIYSSGADVTDNMPNSEEAARRGDYTVIRSLVRVLEGGAEGKRQVDKVIDKCDAMQNLREAISNYRNNILRQPDEKKREASLSFFAEYLERYYFLICFAVYIHTERAALHVIFSERKTFADWMRARPELYSILRRLLWRNPMGALGFSRLKQHVMKIAESPDGHSCEMGVVAAMRSGEVLGSQTVLKSDHCPGCQNLNLPDRVEGAPNFRTVPGFPVYGVANPTVDGIRAVFQRISGSRGYRPVLWLNMREEPVVYINGKPFVLREIERPYKNMLEYTVDEYPVYSVGTPTVDGVREMLDYLGTNKTGNGGTSPKVLITDLREEAIIYINGLPYVLRELDQPVDTLRYVGISGPLVQSIELRIKEDIISEITQSNSEILLHKEELNPATTSNCIVIGFWEHLLPSDVRTPDEVYLGLQDEGYNIEYRRIPLTREREASAADVDAIKNYNDCPRYHLFVSLTGHGGVAYAMIIKCLELDTNANKFISAESDNTDKLLFSAPPRNSFSYPSSAAEEALKHGDYSDILSLTRVLIHGPKCKAEVDSLIERCADVGNLRDDILHYRKELQNFSSEDDETGAHIRDMGIKAMRRYFLLITFRSYLLHCGTAARPSETRFAAWMEARPELGHLCDNLRLER